MPDIELAERGHAATQADELGDASDFEDNPCDFSKETGFNRLTKLMLADDLHTYDLWRVPAKAIHYALLGLSCEITELCSEVDRLEAASNANLGGQKPRYGDSNELKEKKRQMRAPLIEWQRLILDYRQVLELDRPTPQALDIFDRFIAKTFADDGSLPRCTSSKNYIVLGPKQAQLDKSVRDLLQHKTWRRIFSLFRQKNFDESTNISSIIFGKSWLSAMVKGLMVFLMLVFLVLPIAVVSFRAVNRDATTAVLLVLCIAGSLATVIVDLRLEIILVLGMTYATVICTLQQLASEGA